MSAVPNPVDPPLPPRDSGPERERGPQEVPGMSAAAERARAELHEEIERVRRGVEEMLADQSEPVDAELRRELDTIQEDVRRYVKSRVRKSEKKTMRAVRRVDERSDRIEERLDRIEAERREAEWRIHTDTERMLDGLLDEVRGIADRLEGRGSS
jgi:F0F1-type ATP synthase membrane subunit b/b'